MHQKWAVRASFDVAVAFELTPNYSWLGVAVCCANAFGQRRSRRRPGPHVYELHVSHRLSLMS